MKATLRGPSEPFAAIQRLDWPAGQRGKACDAFGSSWRALIDSSGATCDGLCIGCTVVIPATGALGLGQCAGDSLCQSTG
jgi:hypothetical protein